MGVSFTRSLFYARTALVDQEPGGRYRIPTVKAPPRPGAGLIVRAPRPLALGRRRCRLAITVRGATSPLQRLAEVLGFVNVGDGKYHEFEFHVHDVTSRSVGRTVRPYAS